MTRSVSLRSRLALRALTIATRLRRRGRPWSWGAALIAATAVGGLTPDELREGPIQAWERHLLEHHLAEPSRLLVVGSGFGRDLIGYPARGHLVTGIEPAPIAARTSVASLRERGLDGRVINGFAEEVVIDGRFDAVIFSYFCYAYILIAERRIELLKKLRANLAEGGSVIVTYNGRQRFS